jgi:hypothetical protein
MALQGEVNHYRALLSTQRRQIFNRSPRLSSRRRGRRPFCLVPLPFGSEGLCICYSLASVKFVLKCLNSRLGSFYFRDGLRIGGPDLRSDCRLPHATTPEHDCAYYCDNQYLWLRKRREGHPTPMIAEQRRTNCLNIVFTISPIVLEKALTPLSSPPPERSVFRRTTSCRSSSRSLVIAISAAIFSAD